ncbi:MAG TPA: glycoside hydrolase family 6 protein [Solirubrobacteraceae bacterium]|nr:glycoside hydrolase family 6 protein [Solirubrobacteraceae bacterium]
MGTVSLDLPAYVAHENQGSLTITILRTGSLLEPEKVGYGVKQQDGRDGIDFTAIPNTYVTIPAGQATYSFQVPILDSGMNGPPVHALAYLYGGYPAPVGGNTNSIVTILRDDPVQTRDPANPLGVPSPVVGNPIAGAKLYVDPASPAAVAAAALKASNPAWSNLLNVIADEPGARRFWMWNLMGTDIKGQVAHYLQNTQLQDPGSTVMLSSYNLVHGPCGSTATPAVQSEYQNYMDQIAQGIGNFHVIYFLELDSLITSPCLSPSQLQIRLAELRYAVAALEKDPHVVVYLDGGAADALPVARDAQLLRAAGVAQAQGFFLNSTHFDWTRTELGYGQAISKLLGGSHFIINTGENGRGPLVPANRVRNGNEVLCNPPGRGLGPLSVANQVAEPTGYPGADGFLWFTNPGGSGGQCVPGAPPTGTFWPAYAVGLINRRVDTVTGPAYRASDSSTAAKGHKRRKHGTARRKHGTARRKRHHR